MKKTSLLLISMLSTAVPYSFAEENNASEPLFFNSPSKNIFCGGDEHFVSCFISQTIAPPAEERPKECELDWGQLITLSADGKAGLDCHGDFPFDANARILNYGERIGKLKWLCTSSETGMKCENNVGHGFIMSRTIQKIY